MTKGLQCIIERFQTWSAIWKFSDVGVNPRGINTAKRLTSVLMLSVLEATTFQYGFLEEHKVCIKKPLWILNVEKWRLNQNFWSPRKKC